MRTIPYDPPEPYKTKYAAQPMTAKSLMRTLVGKLLTALRAQNLYDGAFIAVMADHGESLGHMARTRMVFSCMTKPSCTVALKLPGNRNAGKQVEARVSLVNGRADVLRSAGIACPREQGASLLTVMPGASAAKTPVEQDRRPTLRRLSSSRIWMECIARAAQGQVPVHQAPQANSTIRRLIRRHRAISLRPARQCRTRWARSSTSSAQDHPTMVDLATPDPEKLQKLQALGMLRPTSNDTGSSAARRASILSPE